MVPIMGTDVVLMINITQIFFEHVMKIIPIKYCIYCFEFLFI